MSKEKIAQKTTTLLHHWQWQLDKFSTGENIFFISIRTIDKQNTIRGKVGNGLRKSGSQHF